VAQEPAAGTGHLQSNQSEQQQTHEQVHRDQLTDTQDRETEHGQQDDQDRAGDRGQLLIPIRATAKPSTSSTARRCSPAARGRAARLAGCLRSRSCTRHEVFSDEFNHP